MRPRGLLLLFAAAFAAAGAAADAPRSVLLVTLDTTRADHLGCYGFAAARTPHLDRLAREGVRFAHAIAPAPLTLPAHASLLTGLEPPEHGLRENGTSALSRDVPTLASAFAARGFATAAFVSSLVLDRRFGLDRGFARYDDGATAEALGEYGYPERNARQVTDAALEWLARAPRPFFLWVHYYDAHSPYVPPSSIRAAAASPYDGEIAFVDRELGRLLDAAKAKGDPLVAVVGDHGESLNEHGERSHGLLLDDAVLRVPLLLHGPGIARGAVVNEPVATTRLAASLLSLAGFGRDATPFGAPLPLADGVASSTRGVYSETQMPAGAFGWHSLAAWTWGRLRLVVGGRAELFDLDADPREDVDIFAKRREKAAALKRDLDAHLRAMKIRPAAPAAAAELTGSLASLGYLSGARENASSLEPKEGLRLLPDYERAVDLVREGKAAEAEALLRPLVGKSPRSIPFVTELAHARFRAGDVAGSVPLYRAALALNPDLDFLHYNLAEALREHDDIAEAKVEYEATLKRNPRHAASWLRLADLAAKAGDAAEARRLLERAASAGVSSATLATRRAELLLEAGDRAGAAREANEALRLAPGWPAALRVKARLSETP